MIEREVIAELIAKGADFIHFVGISQLPKEKNRGYSVAILFGLALSQPYIQEVAYTSDYVKQRVEDGFNFDDDEYYNKELGADAIADYISSFLQEKGYSAFSQSDKSQLAEGSFDGAYKETLLPHKTIAVMAGIGWIGKNNLLITSQFGCGICLGTVLTNAPLHAISSNPILPKCGACEVCQNICETGALKGATWSVGGRREDIINVLDCTTCLSCMVHCPWTQRYARQQAG